jgi:glycosyltransferase involved in cell wall biosynthesis
MDNALFPVFSVIIPTYNRANILPRAIHSVLKQTYGDFELIIVDDGSQDNTEHVVNLFNDDRIKYIKQPVNKGQNASLNNGLSLAKGKYIAFLDSDDEWLPDMLEKHHNKYHNDAELGCVYSWAGTFLKNKKIVSSRKFKLEGYIYKKALRQGYISHMITLSVKKGCFAETGNFDTDFTVCQDDDICLRLSKRFKFGLIREPLAIIHNDAGNQTISNRMTYAEGWEKLIVKFRDEILNECGKGTLARHYLKIGFLYNLANDRMKSRQYLKESIKLKFNYYTLYFLIFIMIFKKITLKILGKV